MTYENRMMDLESRLSAMGSCAICFSGGLDSTVLADIAYRLLGENTVAVCVDVPMMADRQRVAAKAVADSIGIRLVESKVSLEELQGILDNGHDRCYICKTVMYRHVRREAESLGIGNVINGEIVDDLSEDRPGMAAGPENGVLTPFLDAGIRRDDIVRYLDGMDLPLKLVKDTCMLMRYPEGRPVTESDLRLVEDLEADVRRILGLRQLRVRRSPDGFIVQTSSAEMRTLEEGMESIRPSFSSRGFDVSMSPVGYDKRCSDIPERDYIAASAFQTHGLAGL